MSNTTATREKTIDRIKKLLELAANNPSEMEAAAAALAAQRLIAQHHIEDNELMTEVSEENIEEIKSTDFKGNPWAVELAHVIADNFRCRLYFTYRCTKNYWTGRTSKKDQRVVFMGYETDATAATETFNHLFEIGMKLADKECRKARQMYGTASGVKNSFLLGFVDGIQDELEKQCVALVLVTPREVDDYANDKTAGFETMNTSVTNAYDGKSYDSGRGAGRDAVSGSRLSGQMALNA